MGVYTMKLTVLLEVFQTSLRLVGFTRERDVRWRKAISAAISAGETRKLMEEKGSLMREIAFCQISIICPKCFETENRVDVKYLSEIERFSGKVR